MSINFGVDMVRASWTADLLFKNTVIPRNTTVKRKRTKKSWIDNQRLKNAHIMLSICRFSILPT